MGRPLERQVDEFRSPIRKLVRFFRKSRDSWKRKCIESKRRCKLLGNQVRAVEKSRAEWRARAEEMSREVCQLKEELSDLKKNGTCG